MKMVRKQVYITSEQDGRLKRLARELGATEADLFRRALDALQDAEYAVSAADRGPGVREAAEVTYLARGRDSAAAGRQLDDDAWLEELAFIEERARSGVGSTLQWNREDSYDKRRLRLPD